jgi:hypothetical protein
VKGGLARIDRSRSASSASSLKHDSSSGRSTNVFRFIPTQGDSRYLGTTQGARAAEYDYIRSFILSGYPNLEESYRFGELVFPLLPRKQTERVAAPLSGLFGEIVGTADLSRASRKATG